MWIPTVLEYEQNAEHTYDIFSRLLKERIILMSGEITDDLAISICGQMLYLASIGDEDVQLYIHSPGGLVHAGLAIYDTMQSICCDVCTISMGLCASMASVILAGGSANKRYALPNTQIMIHQPIGSMQGQATDMEITTRHMLRTKQRLNEILSYHTHQPLEKIRQDSDRDFYMDAAAAISYGIIDAVIPTKKSRG